MVLLCWDSITTGKTFSPGQPAGSRRTAWSARRFTFSPPIRRRLCSGKWKRRGVCCTAIGLCMTRRIQVFRPKHMSPEELEQGYAWMYRRLFSHASIWQRRPADWRAVAPYLAMSYLYKRSNRFWRLLIKHHLVHAAWRPMVEGTRLRHL